VNFSVEEREIYILIYLFIYYYYYLCIVEQ